MIAHRLDSFINYLGQAQDFRAARFGLGAALAGMSFGEI